MLLYVSLKMRPYKSVKKRNKTFALIMIKKTQFSHKYLAKKTSSSAKLTTYNILNEISPIYKWFTKNA